MRYGKVKHSKRNGCAGYGGCRRKSYRSAGMRKKAEQKTDMSKVINRLFEGDCLEYMEKIPDGSVDMILCDLPYGMTQNQWDCYIPLEELWKQYKRVIKQNGAIVLTSNGVFTAKLILSQPGIFKYKWVWEKSKPTNFFKCKKTASAQVRGCLCLL